MSRHARAPEGRERYRHVLLSTGIWATLTVAGIFALAGGLAFGSLTPLGRSSNQAAASVVTPHPSIDSVDGPQREDSSAIPQDKPMGPTRAPIAVPESPASVSDVYPTTPGGMYGVAIMVRIQFASAVPDDLKAELEKTAWIEASRPVGIGSWSWPTDTIMAYRPQTFWPAHTSIKVHFAWARYGLANEDPDIHFRVGRSQILRVKYSNQMGKLFRDGHFLRKVPVSLGMPGWSTTSGIKAIMEKYDVKEMVNPRAGYDVNVPYAMRLTPSGEFLHAAPWNALLGQAAASHGCTNVSYEDGKWFYEHSLEGDPVIENGTGVPIDWWEGPGALWNTPWKDWIKASRALP